MKRQPMVRGIAAFAVVAGLIAAQPLAASADTLAMRTLKQIGVAGIQRRLTWLGALQTVVNDAQHLTSSDRSSLGTLLSNDLSGLTALESKIQADTDMTTLRADVRSIVDAYHVYVLVTPQVHLTIAADRVAYIATLFSPVEAKLQAAIDKAKAHGKNVAAAQAAYDDLKAKVTAASAAVSGVPAEVLALTPAGYPGNRTTLEAARSSLQTARADLAAARADVTKVVGDL